MRLTKVGMDSSIFYWGVLAATSFLALRRGDWEVRVAAGICLLATLLTLIFLHPTDSYGNIEASVALVDLGVLTAFVVIAIKSPRFWPLWVSGLQLTTTLAHLLRLISPDLVAIAYAAAMRFWSYPILLILIVAALRTQKHASPQPSPA